MRRTSDYIYDLPEWPKFRWDEQRLAKPLATIRHQQGRLLGQMEALGFQLQQQSVLETLTVDVVQTSEIEGEKLDTGQVRSSIARRLGIDVGGLDVFDRHIEGVVDMMLDATRRFDQPLTVERLFGWHASLFPSGYSSTHRIRVGAWRDDSAAPMQVVSGPVGRERVHFEAPAADTLDREIRAFLDWFNTDAAHADIDLVMKAGLAHLWFVLIHPFDDGNGRIARAIADLVLARSEGTPQRFYSMSGEIRRERAAYYGILQETGKGTLDVTNWMGWFLARLGGAIEGAQSQLAGVLAKARFWQRLEAVSLNDRQRLMLNRLLDGFEGHLTTSKWAKIAKCSSDSALRDILDLVDRGVLLRNAAGGRSTSYGLVSS